MYGLIIVFIGSRDCTEGEINLEAQASSINADPITSQVLNIWNITKIWLQRAFPKSSKLHIYVKLSCHFCID